MKKDHDIVAQIAKLDSKIRELQPVPETQTATTKAVFTRNTKFPLLGDAWQAPNRDTRGTTGLIWGDLVVNGAGMSQYCPDYIPPGAPCEMTHADANLYCFSIGARLPTQDEFAKLGIQLGAKQFLSKESPDFVPEDSKNNPTPIYDFEGNILYYYSSSGFKKQVLPHLTETLWAFGRTPYNAEYAYYFSSADGYIGDVYASGKIFTGDFSREAVRCVVDNYSSN